MIMYWLLPEMEESIIIGDKDLLVLKEFESVPILDPRGF